MSSLIGKFLTILGLKRREANVLVVGLDNSGKSTILNYLKRKEDQVEEVVPTVGFTVERLSGVAARNKSGIALTAFDMSGQGRYRNLWEHYYSNVEGIIFVVDSTDALRLVVARDELEMMLKYQLQQTTDEEGNGSGDLPDSTLDNDSTSAVESELYPDPVDEDDDGDGSGLSTDGRTPPSTSASSRSRFTAKGRANRVALAAASRRHNSILKSQTSTSSEPAASATSRMRTSNSASSLTGSSSSLPNANFRRPDIPILFFANKMDLKDALPSVKISQLLGLQSFPHRNWHIQASNAITGEGVQEGIEWIIYQIASNKKTLPNSTSSGSITSMTK